MNRSATLMDTEVSTKRCSTCRVEKAETEFYRDRSKPSGLSSKCKECSKATVREWTKKNPLRARELARKGALKWNAKNPDYYSSYYQENLEREREKRRQWRIDNPDYDKKRYEAKRDEILAKNKAWRLRNPESVRQRGLQDAHKRRALKRQIPSDKYTVDQIINRDGRNCGLCGEQINRQVRWPDLQSLSIDHITPLSRGGTDLFSNVQLAHLGCNLSKSNRI